MATNGTDERPGREARLLILVVAVSVAVLFVLARFRFPAADVPVVTPSAAPLAGLTARATFDDLAGTLADVLSRASKAIAVVELTPVVAAPPGSGHGAAAAPDVPKSSIWTPALRVGHDNAVVYVPAGWRAVDALNLGSLLQVVATDAATETALVHVSAASGSAASLPLQASGFSAPAFVAVVGAASGGLTVDPVFIGRIDPVSDDAWSRPLIRVSGHAELRAGEILFTVDGGLVGMVAGSSDISRVVPPDAIASLVARLTPKDATP